MIGGALANLVGALTLAGTNAPIVGSSGAVSAVVGAYLALFPRARLGLVLPLGLFLEFVRIPAPLLIGFWAGLQLLFTYVGPAFGEVAWWTHIAGFLIGIVFALLSRPAIARRIAARSNQYKRLAEALEAQRPRVLVIGRDEDPLRATDQLLARHEAEPARILAVVAVVAEHQVVIGRDRRAVRSRRAGRGARATGFRGGCPAVSSSRCSALTPRGASGSSARPRSS